jgi:esterase/lipase superfamily enzyme
MEIIRPFVLSSRPLNVFNGKTTYQTNEIPDLKENDQALDFFNLGRYEISKPLDDHHRDLFTADYPSFFTYNNHEEALHFRNYTEGNFKPGKDTASMFEEIFTNLKKTDKILYIYLHGFGNNAQKEKEKQVVPMIHSYFPHTGNYHSPVGDMIFLTWPSQGFTEYKYGERDDVSKMANMTAVFILKLYHYVKNKSNPLFADWEPKIVFHSQSMGSKILLQTAQRINFLEGANMIKKDLLNNFFYRIVMTGADIDTDALNETPNDNNEELHRFAKRVILFSNKKDVALWISRFIFLSGKRLGRHLDEEGMKALPKNVDIIELTGKKSDPVGHNYFTEEAAVITGLQKVLSEFYFDGVALENRGRKIHIDLNDFSIRGEWMQMA